MAKINVVYDCGKNGVRAGFVSKEGTFFLWCAAPPSSVNGL